MFGFKLRIKLIASDILVHKWLKMKLIFVGFWLVANCATGWLCYYGGLAVKLHHFYCCFWFITGNIS